MLSQKKNIFDSMDFSQIISDFSEIIKTTTEKYWEQDAKVKLQALNDFRELRQEELTINTDFFSSQIKVEGHKPVLVRLSREFIVDCLNSALDCDSAELKLTNLTRLEIKILNNFCEFLYKKIDNILIPPNVAKLTDKSEKNINLLFLLCLKNDYCSQLMLSIPQDRVDISELDKKEVFSDDDFLTSNTTVRIKAGSAKITLDELKNLRNEDIIILENSNISSLTLNSGEFEKPFSVKINPSLILNIDNNDDNSEEVYDEVIMEKNLWDDIQIEVNAEFEKVKMTIGELKQITKGQVVDLGSVFDSEIFLYVENKKVARGELLIINDRYAVKLNEVLAASPKVEQHSAKAAQAQQPLKKEPKAEPAQKQAPTPPPIQSAKSQTQSRPHPTRPQVNPPSDDEEFDYSDFEK